MNDGVNDGMPVLDTGRQQEVFDQIMRDVRARLAEKRVTHTNADGSVSVTVDGNGTILVLDLIRGLVRTGAGGGAGRAVQDAVNAARAEAGRRSRRLVYRALAENPGFTLFEIDEEALV